MIEGAPMFAARLRSELKRHDLTQAKLADHLGYTQTAISYWVAGKRQPSLSDLCRLAGAFGVTTDYLLGMQQPEAPTKTITLPELMAAALRDMPTYREFAAKLADVRAPLPAGASPRTDQTKEDR